MPAKRKPKDPGAVPATGRVVLFGATGFTGELVARAMVARGLEPVLAGRRQGALEELAARMGNLGVLVADATRPESVRALVGRGDVLVTTTGPFSSLGSAALEAALDAGAHYVDSTAEPGFVRRVFESDHRAAAAGSVALTAIGSDWVPGNLAAELALSEAGAAATGVRVGYLLRGPGELDDVSGGTRASSGVFMTRPHFAYRGGRIVSERGFSRRHDFELDGRKAPALSLGTSEAFAVPRLHPGLRDVDVYLGWFGTRSAGVRALSAVVGGASRARWVGAAFERAFDRFEPGSTGGPDAAGRARLESVIVAEALGRDGDVLARVVLAGANPYDFTGAILAWVAERIAAQAALTTGAVGPVEAFGAAELEPGVAESGISRAIS